jgi:hypothetical protein
MAHGWFWLRKESRRNWNERMQPRPKPNDRLKDL